MELKNLISKGYFPEEVTPPFQTTDLLKIDEAVLTNFESYHKKPTKTVPYSIPRVKAYRRGTSIPNPVSYIRLSKTIVDNWPDIILKAGLSRITLSPLKITANSIRAITNPAFDKIIDERILRSTGYRYLLKIDIQRFYASIYTHSIPWVLHTKVVSKTMRKRAELYGNALDEDLRNIQDGQTVGIPIGPDSSRIISELVVAHIDDELSKALPYLQGVRVVDDYYLYFRSLADVELARAVLHRLLRELELELNPAKEKVQELPEIMDSHWYNRLKDFRFRSEKDKQRKDLISYFDLSFSFSSEFSEDAVLAYSVSKIKSTIFLNDNWPLLEAFLLKSLLIETKVLPFVCQILISHEDAGYDLNMSLIKSSIEDFIKYHLNMENHFEVTWGLWLFTQLEIELNEELARLISQHSNSIIALTALHLRDLGLIPNGLDLTLWRSYLKSESLYNENWLLAYEAVKKGWLKAPRNYIDTDPFFSVLKNHDVEFYKVSERIDISKLIVTSDDLSLAEKTGLADTDKGGNENQHPLEDIDFDTLSWDE
ncbi:MAG: hypothetical protein JWQ25_686 [Daejeonella sp.]|nr:hypothetical protein [Daejeonella sp.]